MIASLKRLFRVTGKASYGQTGDLFRNNKQEFAAFNLPSRYSTIRVSTNNLGHWVNRLLSFKDRKWIHDVNAPCSPSAMAKAGFYAITADCAMCHYCRKELDGWEYNDIPWEEHESHCPECPFIKFYPSPPEEVKVIDAIKLERDRLLYSVKLEHEKTVVAIEKATGEMMVALGKRAEKVVPKKK